MKKIISAILTVSLCLGVFAGCSNNKAAPWDVSDFSFYDSSNNEIDSLKSKSSANMSYLKDNKKLDVQTKRGVKIGDDATVLLSKYDLSGFAYSIDAASGNTDKAELANYKNKEFQEKYSTFSEALPQAVMISKTGLLIYANMSFYLKDGKLMPYELGENRGPKETLPQYETYSLGIWIKDAKIYDINTVYEKASKAS